MAYSLDPSMKSFQMTIPDDEFSCPLCFELLEEPKSLPGCAHNFCKTCLHEILVRNHNSDLSCPVCRSSSQVPPNGAEGFPTNTLLVRLMDNIPGRNEKRELVKAVATCKEEIERNTKIRDEIEKRCGIINRNKDLAEELKSQVSEYAKEMIEDIKNCEQKLLGEINSFLGQRCGLLSENNLEKAKKKLGAVLEQASNCVYSVEDILKKDDLSEILDMKTVMVEQLAESSKFPEIRGFGNREIRTFDLQLQKNSTEKEDLLGKIVSGRIADPVKSVRFTDSARAEPELGSSPEESSSYTSHSSSDESAAVASPPHDPPGFTQGCIVTSVSLPFEPFSLAVSPHSGNVALLWKENNKVYLYKADGTYLSTITIRYGNLWDVGFSIDDNVIVVNRKNNRLLFYTKDSQFMNQEREIPRTGLKYTYLSVCEDGRLIVTSARTDDDDVYHSDDEEEDDDDDDEIVQCIVVYDADEKSCKRMFGKRHLERPASRAIFHNGVYYIADMPGASDIVYIKGFSSQGQFIGSFCDDQPTLHCFVSLCKDIDSNRLIMGKDHPHTQWIQWIFGSSYSLSAERSPHNCPHNFIMYRQEILPKCFHWLPYEGLLKVEIYTNQQMFNVINYQ